MDNKIEALLEKLVETNENVLSVLYGILSEIETITSELDWSKDNTHSRAHLERLESIDINLDVLKNIVDMKD
ncbi:TPA: hypothetical protein ACX6RB_003630 [Photobacterium damselae]